MADNLPSLSNHLSSVSSYQSLFSFWFIGYLHVCSLSWQTSTRVATVREMKKMNFPGQGKVKEFGLSQRNWNFNFFLKTEMAMAVSLIFRIIDLQNWPHSFVKWLFYSLKVSALLEDLVAEDSCSGSWENVWKMVKRQGKARKKSGNFEIENEWQPWSTLR